MAGKNCVISDSTVNSDSTLFTVRVCGQEYTNADNPFGDQHLLETFVWHKKREQDASSYKLSKKEIEVREKQRQKETRSELEKVKKRRLVSWGKIIIPSIHPMSLTRVLQEREKERELRDDEMVSLWLPRHPL